MVPAQVPMPPTQPTGHDVVPSWLYEARWSYVISNTFHIPSLMSIIREWTVGQKWIWG